MQKSASDPSTFDIRIAVVGLLRNRSFNAEPAGDGTRRYQPSPAGSALNKLSLMLVIAISSLMSHCTANGQDAPTPDARTQVDRKGAEFFEKNIRPILVKHCYECHSESAREQQGGLLLDRPSGWLKGGDTQKAVVPGELGASLLITAINYKDESLQMPPEKKLGDREIGLLTRWIQMGAPGPAEDVGETEFSRLGDQDWLFQQAADHWSFRPIASLANNQPPEVTDSFWNKSPVDRFVFARLASKRLSPSPQADPRTFIRRLSFALTGLPPAMDDVDRFATEFANSKNRGPLIQKTVDDLIKSPAFGEHIARMWLDVARYADTDSFYRPDTRTPHYFPFAFTYRDYVIDAFNLDKPFNTFIREQLAADLMGFEDDSPELAALGFLTVGPHANRSPAEALDDWIDVTSRGLLGLTVACARCHDHKYEPVPTADYYSLRGVFASVDRISPIAADKLPQPRGYHIDPVQQADYAKKRAAIDKKIDGAGKKKAGGNNRSVAQKIRETELAELLLFHPGAPVHTMVVREKKRPLNPVIFVRGDAASPGKPVPRRFLKLLDREQTAFPTDNSGRLALAEKIVAPSNPLTARVFVNRVWGYLVGSHLVETSSNFGLQGAKPTHPELLDWLAADFIANGWSTKHLVRTIVLSRTWRQHSTHRADMAAIDPTNKLLWRANLRHLSIEQIRDSVLSVSGQLDRTMRGRAAPLWGDGYTRRRTVYGYINRFNLDPTLRVFDFPTPMASQPARNESIVSPQALFTLNSPFVIDQADALTRSSEFLSMDNNEQRIELLFQQTLQRESEPEEVARFLKFLAQQERFFGAASKSKLKSSWPLIAQALLMSNEFQYVD